jgi:hypothetical protein
MWVCFSINLLRKVCFFLSVCVFHIHDYWDEIYIGVDIEFIVHENVNFNAFVFCNFKPIVTFKDALA